MFHFGWDHIDAKLIDQRFLHRGDYNVTAPGSYQVWEYLVEFREPGGSTVRLPIQGEDVQAAPAGRRRHRSDPREQAQNQGGL